MTKTSLASLLLIFCLNNIRAAKILAVIPTPSISHQVVFRPLFRELAKRGHDVTVVTTDPAYPAGQAPANLTEIDVHDLSYDIWKEEFLKEAIVKKPHPNEQVTLLLQAMLKVITAQMDADEVQNIIKKGKNEYDLLMLEAWVLPTLIYSHIFKAPVIHLSSLPGAPYNYEAVGAPTHPFLYPAVLRQKLYNLTNWEKLEQLYSHWVIRSNTWKADKVAEEVLKSIYGSDIPSLNELENNVNMLFINTHPIWVDNQPVPPNVVYTGGIHMLPKKELPKDLQTYLDSSKNGVIYFSLGTNVKYFALPPAVIQLFVRVFSQLPYDVLWKYDGPALSGETKNIKTSEWLPQSDVLRHPNVKLFITQGGLQSTDEAISSGVPLVGIPLLADQWFNVQKYLHHQIGVQLDIATLTEDKLREAIVTVTGDKRYRENILRLQKFVVDQPQSPLERAVWWTEHLLRHGGAAHLRAAGANISWTDYLELELVLYAASILLTVLSLASITIYVVCKFVTRKLTPDVKWKIT